MAGSSWASPIHLHHPPRCEGQLSPAPLCSCKQIAQSWAMRNAGSGPGPVSASVTGLFRVIHRDSVPCAIVQPWGCHAILGTAVTEATWAERSCRRGWTLCRMGAGLGGQGRAGACGSSHAASGCAAQHCLGELFCALPSWSLPAQRLPEPCPASWRPWASSVQAEGRFGCCSPESYQRKESKFFKTNPHLTGA